MPAFEGIVFVTGVSGFLGAHVAHQLLEKGYRVRASARSGKVDYVKTGHAIYGDRFEVVAVDDLTTGDLTEAVKGVSAIIHVAAPLALSGTPDVVISGAIDGTLNIIRAGYAAGVRKFVVTSSVVATFDPLNLGTLTSITAKSWNPATEEHAKSGKYGPGYTYSYGKTVAEQKTWNFADAHKGDVDVTTLNPPFLGGPFAPSFSAPVPDRSALSTNAYILKLLQKDGDYPRWPGWADVRDVAYAHVTALEAGPLPSGEHKRILLSSEWYDYGEAVRYLIEQRPELKGRTVDPDAAPKFPTGWVVDTSLAKEILGIGHEDVRPWKETILEAADDVLKLEKEWAAKGLKLEF
ncbi:NAD(P)-binding protein [Auriscalpium vulgare]|uniref:NAD(P)-binding protein n=1 Tax=Auriscalpium vulgare TaxID=40419 RepID=A0ACB8RJK7_9AGAM|nr:NAD(P)-binding protein [Auriscalpium vulgare]